MAIADNQLPAIGREGKVGARDGVGVEVGSSLPVVASQRETSVSPTTSRRPAKARILPSGENPSAHTSLYVCSSPVIGCPLVASHKRTISQRLTPSRLTTASTVPSWENALGQATPHSANRTTSLPELASCTTMVPSCSSPGRARRPPSGEIRPQWPRNVRSRETAAGPAPSGIQKRTIRLPFPDGPTASKVCRTANHLPSLVNRAVTWPSGSEANWWISVREAKSQMRMV